MKKNEKRIRLFAHCTGMTIVLALAAMVAGCAANAADDDDSEKGPCGAPAYYEVEVYFNSSGCPTAVGVADPALQCEADPKCVKVKRSNGVMIRWKAVPDSVQFAVVFDPLVGPQYLSQAAFASQSTRRRRRHRARRKSPTSIR